MSRFALIGAQEAVVGSMRRRLKAGTTIADTVANAVFGDVVAHELCLQPNNRMVALDAAAVDAFATVGITAAIGQPLSGSTSGVDSIDA